MTTFWLLAAGLALVAVAFVLAPLRRATRPLDAGVPDAVAVHRDRLTELEAERASGRLTDAEFAALQDELAAAVLSDADGKPTPVASRQEGGRGVLVVAALLLPAAAILAYSQVGQLDGVQLAAELELLDPEVRAAGGEEHAGELPQLLERLRVRLAEQPDDADGWFLLGRTAMEMQDWATAAEAFRRAQDLTGANPAVQVLQVQALYLGNERRLDEEGEAVANAVLAADPNNPVVLQILAMESFRTGNFRAVVGYIDRALPAVQDPQLRGYLEDGRRQALAALGEAPEAPASAAAADPASAGPAGVLVSVQVADDVRAAHPPATPVFVLARDPARGPMPLAVQRLTLGDLPTQVRLDDSSAMNPGMAISGAEQVQVVARLAVSGDARRGPDDVEALAGPVPTRGASPLTLVLGGEAPASVAAPRAAPPAAAAIALNLLVELDPGLPAPDPATPVFVYARSAAGPPMPVAVQRLTVADLPALVRLDDSMAMMPGRTLGSVGAVELVARVSASGIANAGPGDLEGRTGPLDPAVQTSVVPVRIDARL